MGCKPPSASATSGSSRGFMPNLAVAYCTLTNRCDERGVGAANAAIEIDRRAGQLDHLVVSLVVLGQIFQCHGEPTRALGYYEEALSLAEKTGEPQLLFLATMAWRRSIWTWTTMRRPSATCSGLDNTCKDAGLDADALIVLPFLT